MTAKGSAKKKKKKKKNVRHENTLVRPDPGPQICINDMRRMMCHITQICSTPRSPGSALQG